MSFRGSFACRWTPPRLQDQVAALEAMFPNPEDLTGSPGNVTTSARAFIVEFAGGATQLTVTHPKVTASTPILFGKLSPTTAGHDLSIISRTTGSFVIQRGSASQADFHVSVYVFWALGA